MAAPSLEPSSSGRWTPFIFGGIFLLAAVLILTGVLAHSSNAPDGGDAQDAPATNAPAAMR